MLVKSLVFCLHFPSEPSSRILTRVTPVQLEVLTDAVITALEGLFLFRSDPFAVTDGCKVGNKLCIYCNFMSCY